MKNKIKKSAPIVGVSAALLTAAYSPDTIESALKIFTNSSKSEFAKNCFIFSLAAAIHAGRVKKEIRVAVETLTQSLTISIDKVAEAFREDLKSHSQRLDNLASRVASLECKQPDKKGE